MSRLTAHVPHVAGWLGELGLIVGLATAWAAAPAGAATVAVRAHESGDYEELVFAALPGEANRVAVQRTAGPAPWTTNWTLHDAGAPLVAGPGCAALDEHTARCERPADHAPRLELGDADDELSVADALGAPVPGAPGVPPPAVNVMGGAGDDRLVAPGSLFGGDGNDQLVGVPTWNDLRGMGLHGEHGDDVLQGTPHDDFLHGGPGADRLEGGSGNDGLAGEGGLDTMRGGAGSDTLTDGDQTGASGDAAPGPDLLDGGTGADSVDYMQRRAALVIDLAGRRLSGHAGEGDTLTRIENARLGSGDDWLRGDDHRNYLDAGDGDDVLIGRGGHDLLDPGLGAAEVACGRGSDVLSSTNRRTVVASDCEGIYPDGDDALEGGFPSAYPAPRRSAALRYRIACPSRPLHDEEAYDYGPFRTARCRAKLRLTTASKPTLVLGTGSSPLGRWRGRRTLVVHLTSAGRRLADRRSGVLAVTTLRMQGAAGFTVATARWVIRLR